MAQTQNEWDEVRERLQNIPVESGDGWKEWVFYCLGPGRWEWVDFTGDKIAYNRSPLRFIILRRSITNGVKILWHWHAPTVHGSFPQDAHSLIDALVRGEIEG